MKYPFEQFYLEMMPTSPDFYGKEIMDKTFQTISMCICVFFIGCAGLTPVGSKDYKATILFFDGGSGNIRDCFGTNSENFLICRSVWYFSSSGIKMEDIPFNFPYPSIKAQTLRIDDKHFNVIQKKVNKLRAAGHNRIWLMGISNGAISVLYAGERQVEGVEGLIAINPGASGRFNNFIKITLPLLLITHELDGGLTGYSEGIFKSLCPNSTRPQNTIFSGGVTGTSREAKGSTQKYQHGLRGLEKEFANVVINFIATSSKSL